MAVHCIDDEAWLLSVTRKVYESKGEKVTKTDRRLA